MKFRWIHDKDHPMHLNDRTVVVTGDVSNANIHANGNVTFQGNLRNVNVTDNDNYPFDTERFFRHTVFSEVSP